jgi:hypothetical protein
MDPLHGWKHFYFKRCKSGCCEDNRGDVPIDTITISGDRDGITITYRDPNTDATYTGNIELIQLMTVALAVLPVPTANLKVQYSCLSD